MTPSRGLLAIGLASTLVASCVAACPDAIDEPPTAGPDAVQDLIFLGERRPIFLRLRIALGDRPFRAAWMDSVRAVHRFLDRDMDGTLSGEEAGRGPIATMIQGVGGGSPAHPQAELDVHPKDGIISIDELADGLLAASGPFQILDGNSVPGGGIILFTQLDHDRDGSLSRLELAEGGSRLRTLDLDEDDSIDETEIEPFADRGAGRAEAVHADRGPDDGFPPVVAITPGESTLRVVRRLLRHYDRGPGPHSGAGDGRLTPGEFTVDPAAFARADADANGALDTEELRRFLVSPTPDIELAVSFPADAAGSAGLAVSSDGSKTLPRWARVEELGGSALEIAVDGARLEILADGGAPTIADARDWSKAMFASIDVKGDGRLEGPEVSGDGDHPSPLAGLFDLLDRDGDRRLEPGELDDFAVLGAEAARGRVVLTSSDRGRSVFEELDLDRDRRLGLREVRGLPARLALRDRDGDGRVAIGEIPHAYRLILGRGRLGLPGEGRSANAGGRIPPPRRPADAGPDWFRRMDRNRDGDVSPREFRGTRAQFDRLDGDRDGLLDASEAATATRPAGPRGPAGSSR